MPTIKPVANDTRCAGKCSHHASVLSPRWALSRGSHYIAQTSAKLYHLATLIGDKKHRRSPTWLSRRKKIFSLCHVPPTTKFCFYVASELRKVKNFGASEFAPRSPSYCSLVAVCSKKKTRESIRFSRCATGIALFVGNIIIKISQPERMAILSF